jgi:hypothetical protein
MRRGGQRAEGGEQHREERGLPRFAHPSGSLRLAVSAALRLSCPLVWRCGEESLRSLERRISRTLRGVHSRWRGAHWRCRGASCVRRGLPWMRRGVPSGKWGAAPSRGWTTPRQGWSTPKAGPASMSGPWSTPRRSWATPSGGVATPRRPWSTPDEMGRLFSGGKAPFRAGKRSLEVKWGELGGRMGSSRASGELAAIGAQPPALPLVNQR